VDQFELCAAVTGPKATDPRNVTCVLFVEKLVRSIEHMRGCEQRNGSRRDVGYCYWWTEESLIANKEAMLEISHRDVMETLFCM
jgi:hypothetical protein